MRTQLSALKCTVRNRGLAGIRTTHPWQPSYGWDRSSSFRDEELGSQGQGPFSPSGSCSAESTWSSSCWVSLPFLRAREEREQEGTVILLILVSFYSYSIQFPHCIKEQKSERGRIAIKIKCTRVLLAELNRHALQRLRLRKQTWGVVGSHLCVVGGGRCVSVFCGLFYHSKLHGLSVWYFYKWKKEMML